MKTAFIIFLLCVSLFSFWMFLSSLKKKKDKRKSKLYDELNYCNSIINRFAVANFSDLTDMVEAYDDIEHELKVLINRYFDRRTRILVEDKMEAQITTRRVASKKELLSGADKVRAEFLLNCYVSLHGIIENRRKELVGRIKIS